MGAAPYGEYFHVRVPADVVVRVLPLSVRSDVSLNHAIIRSNERRRNATRRTPGAVLQQCTLTYIIVHQVRTRTYV